jgi:biopolymer transport protein ExbD
MRLPTPPHEPAQISVVAMIDVLFAILTFFIVSSLSLSQNKGVPVNLPAAGNSQTPAQTKIIVSLNDRSELSVNRQPTSIEELANQVRAVMKQELPGQAAPSKSNPTTIIINADEQSGHGQVTQIMDKIRQVPNIKIAIATKQR